MNFKSQNVVQVFQRAIADWHLSLAETENPFSTSSLDFLLYKKCQIDTIQWHEEDEIRRPDLPIVDLVKIKRNIDRLNQIRTNTVELIDDMIADMVKKVVKKESAKMNSETPAWLIDRMSILELKIWHMDEQTKRSDASEQHIAACKAKLATLHEQRTDMSICLDELLADVKNGDRYFKVYRQMKMYNDQSLNPSLYLNKVS